MSYLPVVEGGRTVGLYEHSGFRAVLRTDLLSPGFITYAHVLFVTGLGSWEPVLAVASEVCAVSGSGTHVLGLFPGNGHANLGMGDEWADLATFREKALDVAGEHLGLVGSWLTVGDGDTD